MREATHTRGFDKSLCGQAVSSRFILFVVSTMSMSRVAGNLDRETKVTSRWPDRDPLRRYSITTACRRVRMAFDNPNVPSQDLIRGACGGIKTL